MRLSHGGLVALKLSLISAVFAIMACGGRIEPMSTDTADEALTPSGSGSFCNAANGGNPVGPCIAVPLGIPHLNEVLTMATYAGPTATATAWQIVSQCGGNNPCNRNLIEYVHNGVLSGWYWGPGAAGTIALQNSASNAITVDFEQGGICSPGRGCLDTVGSTPKFTGSSIINSPTQTWTAVGFPMALVANEFESPNSVTHYAWWPTNTPGALMKQSPGTDNCAYQTGLCTWSPPSQGLWALYPALFNGAWTFQLGPASAFGGNDNNFFSDSTNTLVSTQSAHTSWTMRSYANGVPALACDDETSYLGVSADQTSFAANGGTPTGNTVWPVPMPAPQ